jgi:hypothetical protein
MESLDIALGRMRLSRKRSRGAKPSEVAMHPGSARRTAALLAVVASMPSAASCAAADSRGVTPDNIQQALSAARDGDTIVLAPGVYQGLDLNGRRFDKPVVIDARAATIVAARLRNTEGVTFRGGTFHPPEDAAEHGSSGKALFLEQSSHIRVENANFVGPGAAADDPTAPYGEGVGIKLMNSSDVEIHDTHFQGFRSGVSITKSEGFVVAGNTFKWMRSDGIDVAQSRKGLVENNTCSDTRVRSEEHPDCVQMWSRPESPPTADIVIRGNRADGSTQGFTGFNHVHNGVDDGGFDRILIENNIVNVSRPNAITLSQGRDSIVRNNHVTTTAGAKWQARIRVSGTVKTCGNTVASGAGKPGETDPKC